MNTHLFELRPIENDDDHAWAIKQIDRYEGAKEGTPEFEYLMALAAAVDAYEDVHHG